MKPLILLERQDRVCVPRRRVKGEGRGPGQCAASGRP